MLHSLYLKKSYKDTKQFKIKHILIIFAASMKKLLLAILMLLQVHLASSRTGDWTLDWNASARMAGSTGYYMPFWARTGEDGILPVRSSGLLVAGADVSYRHPNGLYFQAGTNLAGVLALKSPLDHAPAYGMVDRLYVSGGWKMLHLDVGMKPRERELSDLTVSGGNFIYSRNARNMPGINAWSDWIYFEKGHWFGIKGNIAHYQYIDNRYVKGAYVHNKSLAMKGSLGRRVDLSIGFDHWAQWGGNSPKYGPQPVSFKDYIRIFLAQRGGEEATDSDRLNVLGNHLGREWVRVDWKHELFTMSFQYDKPFEDGSGMKMRNVPDGIWTIQCSFNDRNAAVTDIVLEYVNTTWQSGPEHQRKATEEEMKTQNPESPYYGWIVLGGGDNYFGNGEYRSGWTNYGRIMGLPLIMSEAPGADGIVANTVNTRLRAFHAGLKGNIAAGLPYAFKGTFSLNYGRYKQSQTSFFVSRPWQLSLAFDLGLKRLMGRTPLDLNIGIYGDFGQVYQNSAGLTLKLSYSGFKRF